MQRALYACLAVLMLFSAASADEKNLNCGPYCLYVALESLDSDLGLFEEFYQKQFVKRFGTPDSRGYSLGQLQLVAQELGYQSLGVKTNLEKVQQRQPPFACIAWIRGDHFVLLKSIENQQVAIVDPPQSRSIPAETFTKLWDGTSLLISKSALPSEEDLSGAEGVLGHRTLISVAAILVALVAGVLIFRRRQTHA